jgi:hypothetical protein
MANFGMRCRGRPKRMTSIEQFKPKYPMLYIDED